MKFLWPEIIIPAEASFTDIHTHIETYSVYIMEEAGNSYVFKIRYTRQKSQNQGATDCLGRGGGGGVI